MNKASTASIARVLNDKMSQVVKKNESKTVFKKILFKAGSSLPAIRFERLSY